jgi:tRNA-Thr(GGU) m(6)t(6)A37 methyltransferase TsaA
MNLEAIGIVHSPFKEKFGTPRQGSVAPHSRGYIEFDKRFDPYKSLQGLEEFSHVWVIFWFHNNSNLSYRPLVNPPRLAPSERVGTLASRSPLRPNPIGLSLVKIEKVAPPRLYLSGLDLVEGTPILDIKPYIAAYDSVPHSRSGWVDTIAEIKLEVEFSDEALKDLAGQRNPHLKQIIRDILASDIRNRNDKRLQRAGKQLGFYYDDWNVVFEVNDGVVLVLRVEKREIIC